MYEGNIQSKTLNPRQLEICHGTMDSTMLAGVITHRLHSGIPTSVVRESDGEQCIMQVGLGADLTNFLKDEAWLTKYGVADADLTLVAKELIRAGNTATYFGAPMAGFWRPKYDIHQHFPNRKDFISVFYHKEWAKSKLVGDLLHVAAPMVLHRDHEEVAANLKARYNITKIYSAKLGSWHDQEAAEQTMRSCPAKLILVSGGPTAKAFVVDMAARYGKVVLDVGNGLTRSWCHKYTESVDRQ